MEVPSYYYGILDFKYILFSEISVDGSSTVFKAKNSFNQENFIVKIFNKKNISMDKEIKMNEIISKINNPSFIKYIHSSGGNLVHNDNIKYHPYIVFEMASKGNLINYYFIKQAPFTEKICKIIFYKILNAIEILHNMGICHGNITIEKILLDGGNYDIKIFDFSNSSYFINEKGQKILLKKKVKGLSCMAPEITIGIPYEGDKADIFNLGVLLYSLLTGQQAFKKGKLNNCPFDIEGKLYKFIKNNKIEIFWNFLEKTQYIGKLSPESKDLITKMVNFNPKSRPNIKDIYNHDWLKDIKNLNDTELGEKSPTIVSIGGLNSYEQEMVNELKNREKIFS